MTSNNLRSSRLWASLLALVALAPAFAQDDERQAREDEAKDIALWKPVAHVTEAYQAPPKGWLTTTEQPMHATFSAPCEFKRDVQQRGGVTAMRFLCSSGTRAYIVVVAPLEVPKDPDIEAGMFRHFSMSNDTAMLKSIRDGGLDAELKPRRWIQYGTSTARQHTIVTRAFDIEVRTLQSRHASVTMAVRDLHANFPGDCDRFFHSLKLE